MRRAILFFSALLLGAATGAVAQKPGPPGAPSAQYPQHVQRQMERQQDMMRRMDQLMVQLRETNEWMAQYQAQEQYREFGREMERSGEQLVMMAHHLDRVRQDPELQRDRERLEYVDRLQDRLCDMRRDLERAHEELQSLIRKP